MSKSYHRSARKFDDDYEEEVVDTRSAKKMDRFVRQIKRSKLSEDRDPDT